MLHPFLRVSIAAFCALSAYGQLITTTNYLGLTVVEDITLGNLGVQTTVTVRTLTGPITSPTLSSTTTSTSLSSTTTSTTTAAAVATTTPPQVVEQPDTGTGNAPPTVYTYTSTNAGGAPVVLTAVFTPTFAATSNPVPTSTGTILDYSEWLSMVGTSTAALSGTVVRWRLDRSWIAVGVATLISMMGGAWLVFV